MRVLAEVVDTQLVVTVSGLDHLGEPDHADLAAALADATAAAVRSWLAEDPPDPRAAAHDLLDAGRSVAQVAAALGISRDTVREWHRQGRRS